MTLQQTRSPGRSVQWYHAGEIAIVAYVPSQRAAGPADLQTQLHAALRPHLEADFVDDPATTRSFVFDAPGEARSLGFFFVQLADRDTPRGVKTAVERLQQRLHALGTGELEIIGVMPHWHVRAHEEFSGPSPASWPRPVYKDQIPSGSRAHAYAPAIRDLAPVAQAEAVVPVAILDTGLDLAEAQRRGAELDNPQLVETVAWLRQREAPAAAYEPELAEIAAHHTARQVDAAGDDPAAYPAPDHGLFVAGLIHSLAPQAPLTLEPVLNDRGVGDLSLLLVGLQRTLERKAVEAPQIVNLSLGFVPHPARLPAAWYGLERPQDPGYLRGLELFDPEHDARWVSANRHQVDRTIDLLQVGLAELARYLRLNNCLVVAATGNDSLLAVERHQARLQPRLPARFETVLGVAATTSDPRQAAAYSNLGDERELGDHVATFGGNVTNGLQPEEGVIGIYSGDFPFQRPNETGWAFWSGTSFATAIVSGIAANLWAANRHLRAADVLAELHARASAFGPYVPALRTPAIEVQGRWR